LIVDEVIAKMRHNVFLTQCILVEHFISFIKRSISSILTDMWSYCILKNIGYNSLLHRVSYQDMFQTSKTLTLNAFLK